MDPLHLEFRLLFLRSLRQRLLFVQVPFDATVTDEPRILWPPVLHDLLENRIREVAFRFVRRGGVVLLLPQLHCEF